SSLDALGALARRVVPPPRLCRALAARAPWLLARLRGGPRARPRERGGRRLAREARRLAGLAELAPRHGRAPRTGRRAHRRGPRARRRGAPLRPRRHLGRLGATAPLAALAAARRARPREAPRRALRRRASFGHPPRRPPHPCSIRGPRHRRRGPRARRTPEHRPALQCPLDALSSGSGARLTSERRLGARVRRAPSSKRYGHGFRIVRYPGAAFAQGPRLRARTQVPFASMPVKGWPEMSLSCESASEAPATTSPRHMPSAMSSRFRNCCSSSAGVSV